MSSHIQGTVDHHEEWHGSSEQLTITKNGTVQLAVSFCLQFQRVFFPKFRLNPVGADLCGM